VVEEFRRSAVMLGMMTALCGVAYPAAVALMANGVFRHEAEGSLIVTAGRPVGSELVGQPFSRPDYFWGRPSATAPVPYNAAASGGSNLGPANPDLSKNAAARLDALKRADPGLGVVPADLVTASGSGLDPHISPAAAEVQVSRVAKARTMPEGRVRELVREHTEGRQFGVLGEPRVNVLKLNLALDAAARR
jgi:potassium-transporting ATPase KdpC subunit